MTKNQENRLSMYLTVQQTTNYFMNAWQTFTAFKNQFEEFESLLEKIQALRTVQEGKITGITRDKQAARINLSRTGLELAGKVYAFASIINNNKLKDRVKFTNSDFYSCRDTAVIKNIQIIYNAASEFITDLADFDVTQDYLDKLHSLNKAFTETVENPRQAVTNRTKATEYLKDYFSQTNIILKERLDKMMPYFREKSPDFWHQYKSARKIVDLGFRKKSKDNDQEESIPDTVAHTLTA